MKFFPIVISLLSFSLLASADPEGDSELKPGLWGSVESTTPVSGDSRKIVWHYKILRDALGNISGAGHRIAEGDETIENPRATDSTLAVFFLKPEQEGGFTGFLIEAYGDGQQYQMALSGRVGNGGRSLFLTGIDTEDRVISKSEARWIGGAGDARFLGGDWTVREMVSPTKGGWDIVWDFEFSNRDDSIFGKGNKVEVNGRDAYPGERKTVSEMTLQKPIDPGNAITGRGVETNHAGDVIEAKYNGWIASSGQWFLLQSFEDGEVAAIIYGTAR